MFRWCYGGTVALILAAMRPDAVEALMIWGVMAYLERKTVDKFVAIESLSAWNEEVLSRVTAYYPLDVMQRLWSAWVRGVTRLADEWGEDIYQGSLARVKCPTLLMHGSRDPLITVHHAEIIKANVRGPTAYHEFVGGRHQIHLDVCDDFNGKVVEFFEAHVKESA